MAIVRLTARANRALAQIVDRRRQFVGFMAARALRERIMRRIYQLRDFPEMGRLLAQWPSDDRRELIVPPYRVTYRIVDETAFILNILDARISQPLEDEDDPQPV